MGVGGKVYYLHTNKFASSVKLVGSIDWTIHSTVDLFLATH